MGDDQLQPGREDGETSTVVVALASERATPTEQATGLGKLAGKTGKKRRKDVSTTWWESLVGLVGLWRRVEQEQSMTETRSRKLEET